VMQQSGVLDNIIAYVVTGDLSTATNIARDNLRAILPPEIQFKFVMEDEEYPRLDNVYPGTDNQAWGNVFERVEERAVASRVTAKRLIPLRVLVWVDNRTQPQMIKNFAENIRKLSWDLRTENNEVLFRNYLLGLMGWTPDVVFIPDSLKLQDNTINALIFFYNISFGGVVGGGGFLYNNVYKDLPFFGIWVYKTDMRRALGYENMLIVNHEHPVTALSPDYVDYAGDNYYIYEYYFLNPGNGQKATPLVENLAYWPGSPHPRGGPYGKQDWVALTARKPGVIEENLYQRTVLFNAHLAQSAMVGVGTNEWINLAQRALEFVSGARFGTIKLFVWRGEGVS